MALLAAREDRNTMKTVIAIGAKQSTSILIPVPAKAGNTEMQEKT